MINLSKAKSIISKPLRISANISKAKTIFIKTLILIAVTIALHLWTVALFPSLNNISASYFYGIRVLVVFAMFFIGMFYCVKFGFNFLNLVFKSINADAHELKKLLGGFFVSGIKYFLILSVSFLIFALVYAYPLSKIVVRP